MPERSRTEPRGPAESGGPSRAEGDGGLGAAAAPAGDADGNAGPAESRLPGRGARGHGAGCADPLLSGSGKAAFGKYLRAPLSLAVVRLQRSPTRREPGSVVSPSGTAALHRGGRQFFRSCSARFRGVGSRGWQVGRAVPHQALPPGSWVRPGSVCPCRGTAPHRTSLACCSRAAVLGEGRSPGPVPSPPLFFAPAPPGASGLTGEGQGRGDGPGGASEPER